MLKSSQNPDLMINDQYMRSFTFRSIYFNKKFKTKSTHLWKPPDSLKIAILKASQKPWSDMINDRYMRYSIILNGYFWFKLNTLDFSVWQLRNCMEAAAGGCGAPYGPVGAGSLGGGGS